MEELPRSMSAHVTTRGSAKAPRGRRVPPGQGGGDLPVQLSSLLGA